MTWATIIVVLLYVFANHPVDTRKDLHKPVKSGHPGKVQKVHDVIGPAGSVRLGNDSSLRTYVYHFEGTAMHKGKPCPDAVVTVHVVTSRGSFFEKAMTDSDGRYALEISVDGTRFEPVDWSMEAHTPDLKKAKVLGSRIMMREDEDTTVRSTIDLQDAPSEIPS